MLLSQVNFRFGSGPSKAPLSIPGASVTIFVGPNNSGKSQALREIALCTGHGTEISSALVSSVEFNPIEKTRAEAAFERLRLRRNDDLSRQDIEGMTLGAFTEIASQPNSNKPQFASFYGNHSVLSIDGPNRFNLTAPQVAGHLARRAETTLQSLLRDKSRRDRARQVIAEAFGAYLVIDFLEMGHLSVRLASRAPLPNEDAQLTDEAIKYCTEAKTLGNFGDGVRAFTGLMIAAIASDYEVLLIDEPEAFLHPKLAFKLGQELSRAAISSGTQVFAATHSADFLMGCVQSRAPLNIVRLDYSGATGSARLLDSAEVLPLMRKPLLRSTDVLDGLFFESVVITESDADRAFYEETNERLLEVNDNRGLTSSLFTHAQNWHTIPVILEPLRKLGIPAAAVVDVDIFKQGGTSFMALLKAAQIPARDRHALSVTRAAVEKALRALDKDFKTSGGIRLLQGDDRKAAEEVCATLAQHGVFIVVAGELESWLPELGVTSHGPSWLVSMFEKLGDDPRLDDYVKPTEGDVWSFLGSIADWARDSRRQGMPN